MWKKAVQSQEETEKILRSTEGENRSKRAQVFKIIIDAENKQWYTECNTDGRTELMELYVTKNQKKLRCGITTGTCCTAAALASARLLFCVCGNKENGQEEAVNLRLPGGSQMQVPVFMSERTDDFAEYYVVKDSGDDPDVTNHAKIYAGVRILPDETEPQKDWFCDEERKGLYLTGEEGIGRVTREGLPEKTGQAAINPVPRKMIFGAVREVLKLADVSERVLITVRIPGGEELAERTFNRKLGIVGGLSVLGTTGILEPMSEKAIVDTIETEIRQRAAAGEKNLLLTPGNYGRGYVSEYLQLDMDSSVKCSNYIGETIDLAVSYGMERILLVGNIGKLVKLAAGIMNTHSKVADGRREIMALYTFLAGGSRELAEKIMSCINTEEMIPLLEKAGLREAVMEKLQEAIDSYVRHRGGSKVTIAVMLFSEHFGFLTQTKETAELLPYFTGRNERKDET